MAAFETVLDRELDLLDRLIVGAFRCFRWAFA